jgi:hypothetical protein
MSAKNHHEEADREKGNPKFSVVLRQQRQDKGGEQVVIHTLSTFGGRKSEGRVLSPAARSYILTALL